MEISVVIHTLNSGSVIRQCLESVRGFDEIIVCDMYSCDDTLQIVREYGAAVVMHEPCNGIPEPARMFAVGQATKEWVFVVDSDEVVPPALKAYLYRAVSQANPPDALFVPRKNYFMDTCMRASFPDYQLRFFRKDKFVSWPVTVHSRPEINGIAGKIPPKKELAFIHLDDNRVSAIVSKMNNYTDRETERRKNRKATIGGLIFKPAYRFVQFYLFKGGFRDGKAGFIYSFLHAYYKFLAVSKAIERQGSKVE
ncbi:MAG: glycosyltransferase family 2 protein [Tannerellaceae bacterium]|jgi:glycosyltransferase involved in cell wall biosynthesis|nr:glycosyltransferase family 2 protein [Tannerellaceae bacterium]